MVLTDALMLKSNALVIEKCKAELMRTPLASWIELMGKAVMTVYLSEKG